MIKYLKFTYKAENILLSNISYNKYREKKIKIKKKSVKLKPDFVIFLNYNKRIQYVEKCFDSHLI